MADLSCLPWRTDWRTDEADVKMKAPGSAGKPQEDPDVRRGDKTLQSSYKTRGRAQSSQPNRGPPKSMVLSKKLKKLTPTRIQRFRTIKISLRPDPRGVSKAEIFKKNTETKYAFCRGKTPFRDKSKTIQERHQFEFVHSVEVERGVAPI